MTAEKDFIGTGWGFPPTFDNREYKVNLVSGTDDINESLGILLSTTVGERVMQPRYGCNLKKFLFEPINASMEAFLRKLVEDAILYFEPRIKMNGLNLRVDDGTIVIKVDYTVKSSNSRGNFVFPFYLEEGAGSR